MTVIGVKFDENGDLPRVSSFVDGLEAIAQKVAVRLGTHLGEWVLNKDEGLPFIEWTQTKPPNTGIIAAVVASEITSTEGVTRLDNLTHSFNNQTGEIRVSADVYTSYGYLEVGYRQSNEQGNAFPAIVVSNRTGAIVASLNASIVASF